MKALRRLMRGKISSAAMSLRHVCKDGSTVWVRENLALLRDAGNRPSKIIAFVTDLEGNHRSRSCPQYAAEELPDALQNCAAGISISRLGDEFLIGANGLWSSLFGRQRKETIGPAIPRSAWKHPGQRIRMMRELRKRGMFGIRMAHFRKADGDEFPALICARVVTVAGEPFVVTSLVDITARSQAGKGKEPDQGSVDRSLSKDAGQTRELDRLVRKSGQLAHVGGWELDVSSGAVQWTDEVARIHDLPPGTPMNVKSGLDRFYASSARRKMALAVREAIRTGKPYDIELPIVTAKQRHKWARIIGRPILWKGKVVKIRGSFQDTTQRKLAEIELGAEISATKQLHELAILSAREQTVAAVLTRILDMAIAVSAADFGTIQLMDDASGDLRIVAHRGLPKWWVQFWNRVAEGTGACGTALRRGRRVIVRDVEKSRIFRGTPGLGIQRRAGVRAVQSTPMVSRSGKVLGMFSTHYRTPHQPDDRVLAVLDLLARQAADLIEHAQSEAALRLSRSQLAVAQRIGHTGSWEWDLRSGKVAWSDELYSIYGVGRDTYDPTITSFVRFVHSDDLGRVRRVIKKVLTTGKAVDFEFRICRADGSVRTLHSVGEVTTRDARGRPIVMVGVNQDITERKQAEEASQANRAKLVAAMESMSDAVFISDVQGNFIDFNRAFAMFHKFKSKAECSRRLVDYPKILDVFMADGRRAPFDQWAVPRALRGERGVNVEYGLRRRDTGERWVGSYSFGPIRDAGGRIVGSVVVARDITAQKAAENALRTLNETLEQRVDERTADLSILNLRLERRVAERTAEVTRANEHLRDLNAKLINAQEDERRRIARELHDDLIQRLASVAIDLDFMAREADSAVDRQNMVAAVLNKVRQVIADMRNLSGRLHPSALEHLGLGEAIEVLAKELSKGSKLKVEVGIRNMPRDIPSDIATCLYRVAQEGLHNVIKHAHSSRVRVRLAGADHGITLSVSDNGRGIEASAKATRRQGLGLTSMNERVTLLGGRFRVTSGQGGGTRVEAWLPVRK